MIKHYLYIKFKLSTPLAVGSGLSKETDKDVLLNSKGEPYIPATALAGMYRSFFKNNAEKYFGYVDIQRKESREETRPSSKESALIVYDAVLIGDSTRGIRNGVGLDECRTAIKGAKFDFEVVQPGAEFWTAVEFTKDTDSDEADDPIKTIASAWETGKVTVGAKVTRGLGRLEYLEIKEKSFDLADEEERDAWFGFDIFTDDSISKMDEWKGQKSDGITTDEDAITIKLTLNQKGISPITVRVYTTEVSSDGTAVPDYSQLTFERKDGDTTKNVVVIPGTSWAGTFRHNMQRVTDCSDLFGKVGESKSKITFSETYFDNASCQVVSRNAIDRFSGGTVDAALFTEKMYYGGTGGQLTISVPKGENKDIYRALAIAIADLHEGFLTVGGESSVGHGLFDVTSVEILGEKEEKINGNTIYSFVMSKLGKEENE